MPIEFKQADMFDEAEAINADAIINTVNCVGVMGKGIALAFKERWKKNYTEYKKLCKDKKLRPGTMFVFENQNIFNKKGPKFIINFPTKDHWRSPSKISFIETGLDAFTKEIEKNNIKSVVMPALGCGNGGLDWKIVKPIITDRLSSLSESGVHIIIIEPKKSEKKVAKMTFARAAMLSFIDKLVSNPAITINSASIQIVMCYLQAYGTNFSLKFPKTRNTPHSAQLEDFLKTFENIGLIEQKEGHIFVSAEGKRQIDLYFKSRPHDSESIVKLLNGLESSVASNGNNFILRALILWLHNKNKKKKNAEQIAKIFDGKSLRKIYPHKETVETISAIMRDIAKTEPIIQPN